jgi:hypothetical protein
MTNSRVESDGASKSPICTLHGYAIRIPPRNHLTNARTPSAAFGAESAAAF